MSVQCWECSECGQRYGTYPGEVCICGGSIARYTVHPPADDLLATPSLTATERATDRLMRENRGVYFGGDAA